LTTTDGGGSKRLPAGSAEDSPEEELMPHADGRSSKRWLREWQARANRKHMWPVATSRVQHACVILRSCLLLLQIKAVQVSRQTEH
jgi:hypothetical protein